MSSPRRASLPRLLRLWALSAFLLGAGLFSTGCIYVVPLVVTGAVVSGQGGGTGGNVVLIDEEADLLFTRGPSDQGDTPEGKGQTAVALQLRVTATKATTLDRLVFSISGSGDDNALTNVGLFADANNNALKDAGERQLGSSTTFSGDEGTATFTNLKESIAAGQSLDLVLVFDIPQSSFDNQTHVVELRAVEDVSAETILLSGEARAVEVLGLPVRGGIKTVSATGALSLRPGPSTPANQTVFPNAQSVVMSQFELRTTSVEAVNVSELIVSQSGSGDLAASVSRADLYQDMNGDGLLDAGDQAITLNAVPVGQEVRFQNLAQVIPASGIVQWLVVYTFGGAGIDGSSFRTDVKQQGHVSATGVFSNQGIVPSGFPIVSTTTITLQRATLNVTVGPFPGGGQASPGQGSVPVLQLQLTAGPAEPVVLSSLRVTGSGTGNEQTDIGSARLFLDSNGDGSPVGETTQLGPVLVYAADNGTLTFTGFQRTIPANTTEFWVLAYDVAAGAGAGVNFRTTLTPGSDFTATGQTSALQITPSGAAFNGGQLDVTGSLSAGPGPVMPPPASVLANDANVPVLQLRLSAGVGEPIRLTGLNVRPAGAANDQSDITSVDLYLDADSSGTVTAGDTLLQSSSYPADDQPVGFGNPAGLIPGDIPSGASRDLLVRYQLSGQAFQDETFSARIDPADITVIGANSGLTLNPGGSTAQSSTVSVRRARFSVSVGPQNPGDSDALAGQPNLPTIQLRLAVGPGEDATMNSLTIRGNGNANETSDITNATLYLDRGTSAGAVDAGDLQLAPAQVFSADDGFVLFNTAPVASFTAGTTHDLLVVYQVSPTSNTPRTFNAYYAGTAEITGTGTSSTLSAQTLGGTVSGGSKTIRRGSLAVAAGANMPGASPVFPNVQNLSVLQLALTAGFPEGVQLNSVRVVASGTADEAQAVTTLKMVLDQNGDGFAAASDPVLGTSAIANDGAVTFNLPAIPAAGSLQVPAGQTRNLLFVYDLSGVSIPPGDLRLELQATTDITTTGLVSLQPIPPTGAAPIAGNQIPLQLGTLALSTTAANPAGGDVLRNQQSVGMLQIRAVTGSVESVRVDSIRVTHTGSGTPATAVNLARLYFDANANGILDADTQLTTTTFSGNTATFTIPGGFSIASVDSSHFLVVYDFNSSAGASDTFQANLSANADLGAVGNSSTLTIPPSGAPLSGGLKTLRQATLALSNGLNPPTNRSVFRDEKDVAVIQLRLDAGTAEPVEVTSVRVTPTGTGNSTTEISRVRLYLEGDPADGVLNGDQLIGDFANYAGGPLTIAPTSSVSIPAGGNKSLLLIVDHNAPASAAGATFGAQVQAATDVVARGVISTDPVASSGIPPAVGAQHTIQEASLTLAQGDAPVGDGTIAIVQTGVAVLQAKISAGAAEAVSVTSMTLTFVGTGNAQTGLTAVRLFRDNNNNGILDGDPLIATSAYGGGGTLTFSLAPGALIVPAAGFAHVLIAYDVGGAVNDLDTFSVRIAASTDLSGLGQSSSLPVPSGGTFPLNGATKTARQRTLTIQAGVVIPDQNVFINQSAVRALTLRATAGSGEGIRITGITLRGDPAGTGDDSGISVRLYRDVNADGLLDAGDSLVGVQVFAADAGPVTYAISPSLDAPPAGTVTMLAVYDLPNTAANNDTFRLRFNATTDIAAVGATSGAPATYLGGPFPLNGPLLTAIRSSLTLSAPTQVPVDEITRNEQDIPMVRLRAAVTGVEDVKLTSVTVRPDGAATGDPTNAQVRLFQDVNNNGTLETGTDTQLGVTQAGSATSVTFTNAAGFLNVPAGGSQDLLVVWDYNGAPTPGQTFAARVNAGDVAAIGSNTGGAITVSGGPFLGGTQTVTDPSLTLAAGPANPTASLEFPGTSNLPVLQARVTAGTVETVRMTQVSVAAIGSGNDATDLTQVRLFRDDNNNGVLDGDTLLGTAAGGYPADDGTINFAITAGLLDISPGGFRDLLVVYDLGPGATVGEAYQARIAATNLTGQGLVSAIAATQAGPTVNGGVKRVDLGSLAVSAGANNPGASTSLRNANNVPQLQLNLVTGPAESVQVTQVVVRGSGTGDELTDITTASLYLDDGDGVVSGGDTLLLGGQAYVANDGTLTFPGLTLVIPASSTRQLLVSYIYGGAGSVGETFAARIQSPAADISAVGVSSTATVTPTGGTVTGGTNTLVAGSLSAAAGANNPGPSNRLRNATNVPTIQLALTAGPAEAVRVTQLVFRGSGTGNEVADISSASLYLDDGDGLVSGGDTLLLGAQTYSGDDGTLTFAGLTQVVPAGATQNFLVVYDFNAATAGVAFATRVQDPAADISATGVTTSLSVTPSGPLIQGGDTNLVEASLALSAGASNPGASNQLRNATPVSQLQLSAAAGPAEAVRITQVVINGSGTGSEIADVTSAALYLDEGDGVVGLGDTLLLAGQTYSGDDGTLTFTGLTQVVPAGGSRNLLVVYSYNAAAAGGTFAARLQTPSADVTAVGVDSAQAVTPSGPTANGGATTLVQATLVASAGANNPGPSTRLLNATPVSQLQVNVAAGPVEDVRLTQVVIRASGTGNDVADVSSASLYLDEGDGVVGAGDTLLSASQVYSGDDGTLTFSGLTQVVSAGATRNLLVVYGYAAATPGGTYVARLQSPAADVTAIGVTSSLAVTPSGPLVTGGTTTLAQASLTFSAGASNPGPSNRLRNATPVSQLQLSAAAGPAEAVRITQVVINGSGTGSEVADVTSAALYLDEGDGVVGTGDTLLLAGQTYSGDDGTLTFAGLTQVVPAGGSRSLLVVYSYNSAAAGGTFAARLQTPSADVTAVGVDSAQAVTPSGPTVNGGATTLVQATLVASAGANNPGPSTRLLNATPVSQLQVNVAAGPFEDVRLTQVVINASGTGNDVADISSASLYLDEGDGLVGAGDTLLSASQVYSGDDGTLTFSGLTQVVSAGATRNLLVVYGYAAATPGGTFVARLQSPAADVTAVGVTSGLAVTPSGPLVTGGTTTLAQGSLTFSAGANNPGPSNRLRNATPVSQLQLSATAGAAEAIRITQVVINGSGTGSEVADVTSAALYLDEGDGVVGTGDTLLQASQVYSGDDGTLTFAGLTQVVPAGGSRSLLVVYSYNAAAAGGTFAARLQTPSADVTAVGVDSAQAVTPGGPTVNGGATTLVQATLVASAGASNPGPSTRLINATPVSQLQVNLAAGPVEDVRVTQVVIRASGTGNDVADVSSASLYLDDGDGLVGGGDTLLQASQTYSGDDGTLTFSGLTQVVLAGGSRNLLVVYSYAAATPGGTYVARLQSPAADVTAIGVSSSLAVTPSGPLVTGGTTTLAQGSLVLSAGANNPGASNRLKNATPVSQLQLTLTAGAAEPIRVTQVVISGSGTGSEVADVTSAALYLDEGDGLVGTGDTLLLAGQTYSGDDGTLTFTGLSQVVPASSSRSLLVVYSYNAASAGGTFAARLQAPATEVTAVGVDSAQAVTPSGPTLNGGLTTLVEASLTVAAGANNPGPSNQLRNATPVSQLQLLLTAGASEDVRVTQVVLNASGTGSDVADVSSASLYLDDGDGLVGGGDTLLSAGQVYSGDDGTLTFGSLTQVVPAGSARRLLVVYSYAAAGAGGTFAARLQTPSADVTAVGVSSAQAITPGGPTVNGGLTTLIEPTLTASLGPSNPAASNIQAGTTGVEVLQLRLSAGTAESVLVSNLRLTPGGTGNDATEITAVALYNDQNGNGQLDGDPLLINSAWGGDDTATNFALSLSIPANGFRDVLVVLNVAPGAGISNTFRASLIANADVTAVGQLSALAVSPSGAPLNGNFKTVVTTAQIVASLSVSLPAGIATASSESVVLPLRLSETSGLDSVRLEGLRVRASGTGGDDTDITFVRLYRDSGALGVLDGDVQIGLSAFFANDGLATFAGLSEVIGASGVGNFLVSYTFAGSAQATDGETYTAQVQVGGLTLVEVGSGQSVTPSGLPQTGPQRTILGAELAASAGASNPGAVAAAPSETDVELLQLRLTTNQAGGATVTNLTLQAGLGTGNDATGIAAATLYEDLDLDGQVGPSDRSILRVTTPFAVDGGTASFAISEAIPTSSSVTWLVAYELSAGVSGGQTFTASASAITASPPATSGLPVAGGTITIAGSLTLSQGGAPARRILAIPSGPEEAALIRLSADAAEAWSLTALTVQASGTANDLTGVGLVRAWLDDGDAVFEPGAGDGAALATALFAADDGAATLSGLGQAIPAGGSVSIWISVDVNVVATPGTSFRVALADGSLVAASGDVSGSTTIRGGLVGGSALNLGFDTTLFGGSSVAALGSAEVVTDLAAGDLDGNGDQDFVALRGDGRVEVRLGNGTGTVYALKGTFFGPNRLAPRRVAVADLNRDGWLDVILVFETRVTVFTNQGLADPGNLNAAVEYAEAGATYQDLALVDYDRDGDLDVVLIDRTAPRVRGRRNNGSGSLAVTDALALVNLPRRVVAGDFDRDGRVDLALSDDSNQVRLALGNGSFFTLSDADAGNVSGGMVVSDLDRDGFPDLLAVDGAGSLLPYLSDAPTTASLTAQAAQASAPGLAQTTPQDLASADLDGNGVLDFLSPHNGTDGLVARVVSASLPFPTTGASAYATGTDPDRLTVADFNGDADPDAIVGSTAVTGQVEVVLGDGSTLGGLAALTSASALTWSDFAAGIASGDLDRDGRPDLVAVGGTNLGVSLQSADLGFGSLTDTALAGAAGGVALGDVDRDGDLDLVVTIRGLTQDRVEVYPGQGDGTFGAPFSALTSGDTNPRALLLLDKDRNGVLDALVAEGSALQLYRGNGTSLSNAQASDSYSAPSPVNAVLSGDFNRDGQSDVAAICSAGTLEVRLGSAGFGFGGAASTTLAAAIGTPSTATLADIDRDGLIDVIVAGALGLEILRGDGAGGFTSQVVETNQAGLKGIAALDLDKDGDLDLLAPHGSGWALYVSSGGFTYALPVSQGANGGASLEGLVVTDLDGDGDQDALFGSGRRELQSALGR